MSLSNWQLTLFKHKDILEFKLLQFKIILPDLVHYNCQLCHCHLNPIHFFFFTSYIKSDILSLFAGSWTFLPPTELFRMHSPFIDWHKLLYTNHKVSPSFAGWF